MNQHVFLNITAICECFANATCIVWVRSWFWETTDLCKCFVTYITFVMSCSSMNQHMFLKMGEPLDAIFPVLAVISGLILPTRVAILFVLAVISCLRPF